MSPDIAKYPMEYRSVLFKAKHYLQEITLGAEGTAFCDVFSPYKLLELAQTFLHL